MSLLTWLNRRPVLQCVGLAIVLNLIMEILSRRSIFAGLGFLVSDPLVFIYNASIIMLTLSVSLIYKRRYFVLILFSFVWIALGATNCVLLNYRTTPLAAIDFQLLKSVDGIILMYLSVIEIVLALAVVLGVLAGMIIAWFKTPVEKPKYLSAISVVLITAVFVASSTSFFAKAEELSSGFGNLADAYIDYGFAYCFSRSIIDRGIDEPSSCTEENIARLLEKIHADEISAPEVKPNIIMVQLESFFDVNYLIGRSFSENPIPVFSILKDNYPHGFLTVPTIGAGTANTEFEILSGMSLDYFGAGEYPYKTVLNENTTESICFNLAELGYTNHAIHNHLGTFYERHVVFSNLGFDTFTSIEYMRDVEYNPLGWAKDEVLTEQIMKALTYTAGQDFVYAISVQAHGKYPEEVVDESPHITVGGIEGEKEQAAFEYFINQLHETDAFIQALINQLSAYEEPVALVLFGDHLPSMNIENEDLINRDRFETEYVLWSNYDLDTNDQDLSAYQLGAHVMKQLGLSSGILSRLHQTYGDNEDYQAALELLEYDMVCGEQFAYGGENPHAATNLHMGISEITVTGIQHGFETAYVTGEGFTEWSKVLIDDEEVDTTYIDGNTLMIPEEEVEAGASLVVAQIGDDTILSKTYRYECP